LSSAVNVNDRIRMLDLPGHPDLDVGRTAHHFFTRIANVLAAGVEDAGTRKVAGGKGRDRRGRRAAGAFGGLEWLGRQRGGGDNDYESGGQQGCQWSHLTGVH
jgi:hypothetical protein